MRLAIVLLAATLAACGAPEPPLVISELEITQPMPGGHMSAGFFVVTNNTDELVRITGVASPQFASVEIHETTVTDGVSRMRELEALQVPAQGSIVLERGGKHLMLMQPHDIGDSVTLQFISGDAPVLSVNYVFPKEDK
jgi:copper(I)-binding protein